MRLDILVRNAVLGVALAGLMTSGAAQARNRHAANHTAKVENAKAAKAKKHKKHKDRDRDPNPDNDMNKGAHNGETMGKHVAKGHSLKERP